ncbi:MAG: response regulator transcription factor [Alphaproteobacteria bacterium]|nr:response regulator transcription factor [Alphaproteobacteria bacterium]
MIRVLVADDHPIVRHGLRRLINLQADMDVVGEAADGSEVVRLLEVCACEVIVLDLSLPHIRGLELVHLIRERHPELRILVFSVQPEDTLSLHLLEAGVAGYLSKDRGVDAVVGAIREVAAGRRYLTPELRELAFQRRGEQRQAPHEQLSLRERQVFDRLIQGMSVSAIAGELEISASTCSNHLSKVREKLGVNHNGEVLVYAARAGLL